MPAAGNAQNSTTSAPGRPWLPGQSGNPGGRPKGLARYVRELVGEDGKALADIMWNFAQADNEETRCRMDAIKWLGERGWGKPIQSVEHAGPGGRGIPITHRLEVERLTRDERTMLRDLLARVLPDDG